MRSLSNPNVSGPKDPSYQPKTMAQYDNTTGDNGGVHINNGIPNHAFYLFATAVSKEKAEQVYYRALTTYLVRTSQFLNLRLAIIRAVGYLFGATGTEVTAAKNAFDAVGIMEGTPTTPGKQPDLPVAAEQDLLLLTGTDDGKLYSTSVGITPAKFDPKSTSTLLHRPSVTDDGKYAYYVSADKRIRSVNLTGTPTETVISNETIWDNVAISKDGTKLAALTADKDGSVYVYSYAQKKWTKFRLYNPTNTKGVTTGEVQYADSFEWDFAGENIVYDAFNAVTTADGDIEYWDVGFINVWNNKVDTFAKGTIEKLFSDLEPGESVGNPSYAKNSPDVIAFDYFNENDNSYYVVATDLSKGDLQGVYQNNTLGFPSYSRLDNKLVFSTKTGSREDVASIGVGTDKLTPSGTASVLYQKAKWPVWYTQATRALPTKTAQTITFGAIADRYADQGDMTLRATSSSGLPVSFQVRSGPASLTGPTTMRFSGPGMVTMRAYHDGNDLFWAATPVDRTFAVLVVTGLEPTWSDALSVYPNPARTLLTVELPGPETIESVTLSTATGAGVLQSAVRARQHTATLEMGHLPKGLYFLQIQTPSGTVYRKVLKE